MNTACVFGAWSVVSGIHGAVMAQHSSGGAAETSLALAAGVLLLIMLVGERVLGRTLGVWDLLPPLGPKPRVVWASPRYPQLPPPPTMFV